MALKHRQSRRRFLSSAGPVLVAFALGSPAAFAQEPFPSRPVTIIVPFAAGGGSDILARLVAHELGNRWKSGVIVENKPGAGGQIGNAQVARAKADGYTLLLGITTLIQAPALYKNLPYDIFKDFTPLAQLATSTNYLVVPAASPVNSLKEYIAYVKARQGRLSYGSNGNAGTSHLHGALLDATQRLGMVHVPYAGSGPLLTALLGHQVDGAFVDIAPLRQHVAAGKLKVLAGTGNRRSPALPNVLTLDELGIPGFDPVGWFALLGPANLPEPVRKATVDALEEVLQSPDVMKKIEELGLAPAQLTGDAFGQRMREDKPKWEKMIEAGNVKVD